MNNDWHNWIERLDSDSLSGEELKEFQRALDEDPTNAEAYLDALLLDTSLDASIKPESPSKQSNIRYFPIAIGAAAAIIATVSFSYFMVH